jgi:serine/threonine-protein kinase RsbW
MPPPTGWTPRVHDGAGRAIDGNDSAADLVAAESLFHVIPRFGLGRLQAGNVPEMNQVDKSRPPPAGELRRWRLTCPAELRSLRTSLHAALSETRPADHGGLEDISERIALVATELATNALQHGLPPTTVRLLRHHDRFVLDVVDHDPGNGPLVAALSLVEHRGRGLPIIRAMSLDVGWYSEDDAKHVWASFASEQRARSSQPHQ